MTVRVGMIGCGNIAKGHLEGYLSIPERAVVVALADVSADAVDGFGERCPEARRFSDYRELISSGNLDAVDICLPHHLHKDAILASIEAGLHWICEKPLCLTLREAEQIEQAMADSDRIGMSAHNQVFMPALNQARRMMDRGMIGRVYTIISQDCFILGGVPAGALMGTPPRSPIAPGTWRASRETMGGGELIDTGYHPSYRLLFLAQSEPQVVAAVTHKYRHPHLDAEDTATVLVKFENGITGLIRTSWAFPRPGETHYFYVVGEKGTLYGGGSELWYQPHGFPATQQTYQSVGTFLAEVVHFVDCIESGNQPIQTYHDGIAVLRMILRAYEFAEKTPAAGIQS